MTFEHRSERLLALLDELLNEEIKSDFCPGCPFLRFYCLEVWFSLTLSVLADFYGAWSSRLDERSAKDDNDNSSVSLKEARQTDEGALFVACSTAHNVVSGFVLMMYCFWS